MYRERKENLSIVYYLRDLFSDVSGIDVVDAFPTEPLTVPTISSEAGRIDGLRFELGNRDFQQERVWFIDIFVKNKSQRDEFSFRIINAIKDPIPVYDYDEGFPPTVSPSQIGILRVDRYTEEPFEVDSTEIDILRYRAMIKIVATFDNFV